MHLMSIRFFNNFILLQDIRCLLLFNDCSLSYFVHKTKPLSCIQEFCILFISIAFNGNTLIQYFCPFVQCLLLFDNCSLSQFRPQNYINKLHIRIIYAIYPHTCDISINMRRILYECSWISKMKHILYQILNCHHTFPNIIASDHSYS